MIAKRGLLVAMLLPLAARASVLVDCGGARELVANPVHPWIHALGADDTVLTVDIRSATVIGRVPLPFPPSQFAIERDGVLAYVTLPSARSVAIVDLVAGAVVGDVPVVGGDVPMAIVMGRPGRAYALAADVVYAIDTVARAQVGWVPRWHRAVSRTSAETSSDDCLLYAVENAGQMQVFDVSDDAMEPIAWTYIGSNARGVVAHPVRPELFIQTGGPYYIQVLSSQPPCPLVRGLFPGRNSGMALSNDGGTLYAFTIRDELVATDTSSGLSTRRFRLSGRPSGGGPIAVSADGQVIAVARAPDMELVDRSELEITAGALTAHVTEAGTGRPLDAAINPFPFAEGGAGWLSLESGTLAYGALEPGDYTVTFAAGSEYESVSVPVTIRAGEWTHLGTVPLECLRFPADEFLGAAVPPLRPGSTGTVSMHGYQLPLGGRIEATSPFVTVDWSRQVGVGHVLAGLTVDASAPDGETLLRYVAPGGAADARLCIRSSACSGVTDVVPPAEVEGLRLMRAAHAPVMRLTWAPVSTDLLGGVEVTVAYELSRATTPVDVVDAWRTEPMSPADVSLPAEVEPLVFYRVRARDAAGNLGP